MSKFLYRLLFLGMAVFVLLGGILVFRAWNFGAENKNTATISLTQSLTDISFDMDMALANLTDAIRLKTISFQDRPTQSEAFTAFESMLSERYPLLHKNLTLTKFSEHSLLFRWQGSNPALEPLILMAHQDVVPVTDQADQDWLHPPFSGHNDGQFIWGRGAIDDKGSLIAICEAVEALAQSGFKPKRDLYLAFGHDEEIGGDAGAATISDYLQSKEIRAWMVLDEGTSLITKFPLTGNAAALVSIGEKGYANTLIQANGAGGHSSAPGKDNVIYALAAAASALQDAPMPAHSPTTFEPIAKAVAKDLTFSQKIFFANFWLFGGWIEKRLAADPTTDAFIRTTIAPTMLQASPKENVLPRSATLIVNHRVHPADDLEKLLEHMRSAVRHIEKLEVTFAGDPNPPSPLSSTQGQAYQTLKSLIEKQHPGMPVIPVVLPAGTDAKWFTPVSDQVFRFTPYQISPSEMSMIHGLNERISHQNLEQMIRFYAALIQHSSEISAQHSGGSESNNQ